MKITPVPLNTTNWMAVSDGLPQPNSRCIVIDIAGQVDNRMFYTKAFAKGRYEVLYWIQIPDGIVTF